MPHAIRKRRLSSVLIPLALVLASAGLAAVGGCAPPEEVSALPPAVRPVDPAPAETPLEQLAATDHVALLEQCLRHYDATYRDYACTFVKQERLQGRLGKPQAMHVQFLDTPFSVGMKWVQNPPLGDRLLYIEGRYDGKILVRPASPLARVLLPTVAKDPTAPDVLRETRNPVTRFGFKRGLQHLLEVYRTARDAGELQQASEGVVELEGRRTLVLLRTLPQRDGYPAHITRTYIDLEYLVPVLIEGIGWENELLSRYRYTDVRFNLGLAPEAFQPAAFDLVEP